MHQVFAESRVWGLGVTCVGSISSAFAERLFFAVPRSFEIRSTALNQTLNLTERYAVGALFFHTQGFVVFYALLNPKPLKPKS